MKSKVFVSCGQRPDEKEAARKIGELLEKRGFEVYIAIDVQTIIEINTGIIRELTRIIREGAESSYFSGKICRKMITAAFQAQPVA